MKIFLILSVLATGCVERTASPYDLENQCWENPVVAGDTGYFSGCTEGGKLGIDEDGRYWSFSNGNDEENGFGSKNNQAKLGTGA